jgi:hypothetical protein
VENGQKWRHTHAFDWIITNNYFISDFWQITPTGFYFPVKLRPLDQTILGIDRNQLLSKEYLNIN